ncbi:OsmC family protein [Arenimonas caeni]|uniref:Peroxiredoxin n=1 Tax=Arenimonas caeni TaxID=2058085 RepID=A0A2P6M7F4_9GAMM|nr:OsmC family protein [Arenimonas caeni]MDY0022113.1 OsmC family protein [Arenimonas caeni]PRH81895.1 peroxiredoxin [Arenimonas caeni]
MDDKRIEVTLHQQEGYAFRIEFGDGIDDLLSDEPAPLGQGQGPNPSKLLLAAVANCLAASLTFALRKFGNQPGPVTARISGEMARNEAGRWRIPRARVEITLAEHPGEHKQFERVLSQFEQFCVVTQSVRDGIDVEVEVRDVEGRVLLGDKSFEAGA